MRINVLLFGAACLGALALGCHHHRSEETATPMTRNPIQLQDVDWRLATLGGKPVVNPGENDKPVSLRLDTEKKRATGYSGVNQFTGGYTLDGQSLTFTTMAMTRRAGPPELMQQESAYGQALAKTTSWRAAANGIELLDASGAVLATFTSAKGTAL